MHGWRLSVTPHDSFAVHVLLADILGTSLEPLPAQSQVKVLIAGLKLAGLEMTLAACKLGKSVSDQLRDTIGHRSDGSW